ncbi:hypothetical protein SAY87_013309 [Trapa incisa]|uniref:Transmembrane protein n=1 Tax=Trapa incisa TaxID=236973 RepID=A0AAN7KBP4_9MYRT|nr:hypothetical protein SAY87_013309 [Trapa incisa]
MVSSSSASSSPSFKAFMVIFFMIIHLISSSSLVFAAGVGPTTSMIHHPAMGPEMINKSINHKPPGSITSFMYRGRVFGYLPKKTKVSPSGPSKRQNAAVDSKPKN